MAPPITSWAHPLQRLKRRWEQLELMDWIACLIDSRNGRLSPADLTELEKKIVLLPLDALRSLMPDDPWATNFLINVWEYATGATHLTSYPWNISLPVADVCNARCSFCTSWLEGREILDLEKVDDFAEVVRHAIYVGLVGHGEPLAHPEFDILCDKLSDLLDERATCYTITNGVFLEKWLSHLERINLHSYSVSLNAATAETHNEVMGLGGDAFPRIIRSIERLAELRDHGSVPLQIYITMVVTRQNVHEAPAFIELGNRLGVSGIWLRTLLPQAGLLPGLNYHLLPAYLHPEFDEIVERTQESMHRSRVPVQAEPGIWKNRIFSPETERLIQIAPPKFIPREEALRSKKMREAARVLYDMPVTKGVPLASGAPGFVDPLEDGLNPLNRQPRFACKAVYYNLYINEFFYRLNPCCYMYQIPGFEEVRFDGSYDFFDAWNSPAMVELRHRLNEGPLFGACKRCPEKW